MVQSGRGLDKLQGEDWNFGHYNSYSQDFDEIAYDAPYYLIVESAGNDRGDGPGSDPDHPDADGPYDVLLIWL